MLSHQVGQVALHAAQAQVNAGLAEINRLELRVAICHVQKGHIAKFGNVVQTVGCCCRVCIGIGTHAQASHGACAQDLHKFTF